MRKKRLLQDEYPTRYLPRVGRQVMQDGGTPDQILPRSQEEQNVAINDLATYAQELDTRQKMSDVGTAMGQTWPVRMAKDLMSGVTAPGDVYQGRLDPKSDEAIERAIHLSGAVTGGGFSGQRPAGSIGMGGVPSDRINMNFTDVTKRVPELTQAAPKVSSGEMSPLEYQALIDQYKPVRPWEFVPQPATRDEMVGALRSNQKDFLGKGQAIPEGHPVGLRLDIPAYRDYGVWVPTVHDMSKAGAQPVMAHEPFALISNVNFRIPESKAMKVAEGGPKSPFATINGEWTPTTQEGAVTMANAALKSKEWRQVGMDPERHSYFYDRATQNPIVSAEQVLQVGPLVLAKNPVYAPKDSFKYNRGGSVIDHALMLLSNKGSPLSKPRK
jgi:hypothetical protein